VRKDWKRRRITGAVVEDYRLTVALPQERVQG